MVKLQSEQQVRKCVCVCEGQFQDFVMNPNSVRSATWDHSHLAEPSDKTKQATAIGLDDFGHLCETMTKRSHSEGILTLDTCCGLHSDFCSLTSGGLQDTTQPGS